MAKRERYPWQIMSMIERAEPPLTSEIIHCAMTSLKMLKATHPPLTGEAEAVVTANLRLCVEVLRTRENTWRQGETNASFIDALVVNMDPDDLVTMEDLLR